MADLLLTIRPSGGKARSRPVRFGVPLARGAVADPADTADWVLTGSQGESVAVQTTALARWPDGSIKWLLVDGVVPLPETGDRFVLGAGRPAQVASVHVTHLDGDTVLETGPLRITITAEGRLIQADSNGTLASSSFLLLDETGTGRPARVTGITTEAEGPIRATVRIDGRFDGTPLTFTCRVDAFAGLSAASVHLTLHNPNAADHPNGLWDLGDAGSVRFRQLAWRTVPEGRADHSHWRTHPDQADQIDQADQAGSVSIHQASSGGEQWDSLNHMDAEGRVTLPFKGYRVRRAGETISEGERCQPTVGIGVDGRTVGLSLEQFWQNFPKRLGVDGDGLLLELFPDDTPHELQGGERKTHRFWLGRMEAVADLACGCRVTLDPRVVIDSGAIPLLTLADGDPNRNYAGLIAPAVAGERSFIARREIPDEYGWRHFGDLFADHEAPFYRGADPLISHYNNQYDCIFGMLVQCLRSGDARWIEPAVDLARHVIDIDIYHTDRDRSAYNGGLFWHTDHYEHAGTATHRTYSKRSLRGRDASQYGGGPANEHNYSTGLMVYYYLTGDPEARRAVLGLANWVVAMDDGRTTVLGWVDDGPTGYASRTCEEEFHGPGRGAGHAINTLLDGAELSGDMDYLAKAEQLIRRTIHPRDDLDQLRLLEPELRWSYTIYLQVLGRYLLWKEERGQLDAAHDYARESLLHYARWMAQHESPWLDRPEQLEYPTETWAAQEVRKACVLDLAGRYAEGDERDRFAERAAFFYRDALSRLAGFDTRDATRPLAILLSCGWQRSWFQAHPDDTGPVAEGPFDHGMPEPFESQKVRVKRWIKSPRYWPKLVAGLFRCGLPRLTGRR